MRFPAWRSGLILGIVLVGAGCTSRSSTDEQKKVEELQAQLDDVKKQLAAKGEGEAAAPAQPAAPAVSAERPATAASGAGRQAPKAQPPGPPGYVTTEQGQNAATQYSQDKAKVKGALEEQTAINQQQASTNQQVQGQIEELKPREYTIPSGTVIPVRTTTELSTSKLSNGSVFDALLEKSLVVNGTTIAPEGAPVTGVVVSSDPGGRVKGVASLSVTIRTIAGVRDQTIRVKASSHSVDADTTKGRDAKRTGVMTGVGAAIGAIAGGGKGAAIGAGAGAAAGVGTNAATRGAAAVIPAETVIPFTLTAPSTVVVRP